MATTEAGGGVPSGDIASVVTEAIYTYAAGDFTKEQAAACAGMVARRIAAAGYELVDLERMTDVKHWADHFAPCVEDENNWYRQLCPMDGKDAAMLGELLAGLVGDLEGSR